MRIQVHALATGAVFFDQQRSALEIRGNLLEHRKPFAADTGIIHHQSSQIAAGPCQTLDESRSDRVGNPDEDDREVRVSRCNAIDAGVE